MKLPILNPFQPEQAFPPVHQALQEPDGLLAVGGCLSVPRLLNAYQQGIFPWFNEGDPILWWSPQPRLVLFPKELYVSRRLEKTLRSTKFIFTIDQAFAQVIEACSKPREYADGTWISDDIQHAYTALHKAGYAHSAEVWQNGNLVGGLYGVALGQIFFGESMFHLQTDASKMAFVKLTRLLASWHYQVIDCQVHTQHLASLGAGEISREAFTRLLQHYTPLSPQPNAWQL